MSSDGERTVEQEMEFRRKRQEALGGSDFPALFGFDSRRDALDVYHEKTRPVREEDVREDLEEGSIDLYRGNRLEKEAARDFFRLTEFGGGRHETRRISHPEYRRIAVHVDGTIYADDSREPPRDETGVLEIKSPRASVFQTLVDQGVSRRYIVQLHANCAVTRRRWGAWGFYCLHHQAGPVMPVPVDLDEEFGRMLLERGEEFMLHHVEERIPPDPDEWDVASTGEADELLDRSGEYVTLREDEFEDAVRLARQELERKAVLDVAEERYEEARERLKSWIEEHLETDAIQVPSRVDGEEVLDKFRIIRKAGGTYVRTSQLLDSRPVDRDALVRMLQQWRSGGLLPEDFDVEETVEELALDVGRFEGEKSPSVYLREWPKGDLRERFDLE